MSVDLGSAHGSIVLDSSGVARGVGQAQVALVGLERTASTVGRTIAGVAVNVAKFGAVMGVLGGGALAYAVNQAASFEQRMSGVAAVAGATAGQLNSLKEMAIALGQATDLASISASDAAVAMEELAKGGVGVEDILNGAARGALLLASAGGIGVAQAAEIAANAINIFSLKGADMAHVADLFAAAANSSSIDVGQLGQSLAQGGQVAAQFGISLEEVTATFAAFGAAGLKGSDAGTSFKTFLLSMVNPTKQAQAAMNQYGLTFFDANGKMKSMTDIAATLRTGLGGLSDEQRASALSTIFGTDAIRAATVMYNQGSDGITSWLGKVDQAGSAARLGATRVDNLKGSLEQLKSSIETVAIRLGAAITPALKHLVDGLTGSINGLVQSKRFMDFVAGAAKALDTGLGRVGRSSGLFAKAMGNMVRALFSGDFNAVFGPLITGISVAFGSSAAGKAVGFVSKLLRAFQLIRDGIVTARLAMQGKWQIDPTIQPVIAGIGRVVQLVRDAIITAKQAWAGKWTSSDGIQPVVNAIGRIVLAVREFVTKLQDAGKKFGEVFTPARLATLKQLADDFGRIGREVGNAKVDVLVVALKALGDALPGIIAGIGTFVGWLIDGIGWLQNTGHATDVMRIALIALGAWIALNKIADLVTALGAAKQAFDTFASAVGAVTRGPRLVVTTLKTVYETAGTAAKAGASAVRTVTTNIATAFATAQDAVIWGQLYGAAAKDKLTKSIATAWDAIPPAPKVGDLIAKIMPTWELVPAGPNVPEMKVKVVPEISASADVTSGVKDIGVKIASGIASGLGGVLGGYLVTQGSLAALGAAAAFAAGVIVALLQAATLIAIVFAAGFAVKMAAKLIEQNGGIANALTKLFTVALPNALGQLTGILANAGLTVVLGIITGITQGIPALLGFIQANFTTIVLAAVTIFTGLPGLLLTAALAIWQVVGPTITAFGTQVLTTIGTAFSQIGTIVNNAWNTVKAIVVGAVTGVVTTLVTMGTQVLSAIQTAFSGVAAVIKAIMAGDWGAAIEAGKALLVAIFVTLPQELASIVGGAFDQIGTIISGALDQIGKTFSNAWESIKTVVGGAFEAIGTAASEKLEGLKTLVSSALKNLVKGFHDTFSVSLLAKVKEGLQEIRDNAVIGMRRMGTAISKGLDDAIKFFKDLPGRITTAVGNLSNTLYNAGRDAVQGLINGVQSLAGAVGGAAAGLGKSVINGVKGALGIRSPSKELIKVGRETVMGLVVGMDDEQQAAAKKAAEVASAVAGAIKSGVEALNALATFRAPTSGQAGLFTTAMLPLIDSFVEASGRFETDALKAASAFADAASKVASTVKSGVDGLTALGDFVPPTAAQMSLFTETLLFVVGDLVRIAAVLEADGVASAAQFSDAAKKIIDVLQPAVGGLTALTTLKAPSDEQVRVFGERLLTVIVRIGEIGNLLETEGVKNAADFSGNVGKIAGLLGPGATGLTALTKFDVPSDAQINTFGERLLQIIVRIGEIGGLLAKDGVKAAGEFATNAVKVTGLLSAAKSFNDLANFKPPSEAVLNQFVALATTVVSRIADAARVLGEQGIKQAGVYGENASKAVGLIGTALGAFKDLSTFTAPSATAIEGLVSVTGYTVDRLIGLATKYDPAALGRLTAFAEAADKGFSALKSALSAAKDIASAQDGPKPVDAVNTIIGQLQTGLGPLQALAGLAGQWETLSASIRTKLGAAFTDLGASVAGVTGGGAAAITFAGGATTTRSEITVRLEMPADDGRFVARSLRVDGRSRGEVADMIAGEIAAVGAAA